MLHPGLTGECKMFAPINRITNVYMMANRANVAVKLHGPSRNLRGTKSKNPDIEQLSVRIHGLDGLTKSVTEKRRCGGVSRFFEVVVDALLSSCISLVFDGNAEIDVDDYLCSGMITLRLFTCLVNVNVSTAQRLSIYVLTACVVRVPVVYGRPLPVLRTGAVV